MRTIITYHELIAVVVFVFANFSSTGKTLKMWHSSVVKKVFGLTSEQATTVCLFLRSILYSVPENFMSILQR